jgi:hypothetical protein
MSKSAQDRIDEWMAWRHDAGHGLQLSSTSPSQRIIEDNYCKQRSTRKRPSPLMRAIRKRNHLKDHIPCKETRASFSDGGLGACIDRMAGFWSFDKRCLEIQRIIETLARKDLEIIQARYIGSIRDVPRPMTKAAELLNIPPVTFFDRHKRLLAWIDAVLKSRTV